MRLAVFGYNFPHFKTVHGLINMCAAGFAPEIAILQDRKSLNIPRSPYRVSPDYEFLPNPADLCERLGIKPLIMDHDAAKSDVHAGVILGARILKRTTVESWPQGIINIHPGILPGNRGLDNLKWSIHLGLPVGVTAHLIDHRIDMGLILKSMVVPVYHGDSIRDVYIRQREYEQRLLIETLQNFDTLKSGAVRCAHSEKFSSMPDNLDHQWALKTLRYACKRDTSGLPAT